MGLKIIVMVVTLAMPNGESGVHVKPMANADACRSAAAIEASDPFVFRVECSELEDGVLKLEFDEAPSRRVPETTNARSTG